jgi:hypothetical protein
MVTLDEFDNLLLRVIDETLRYVLGDINTGIILDYLEKKSCSFLEIPRNLDVLSMELRNLLGSGGGQILGSAPILEETIVEVFCRRLGMEFDKRGPIVLADYIEDLKELCHKKEVAMLEK